MRVWQLNKVNEGGRGKSYEQVESGLEKNEWIDHEKLK
jgi:hypothetical protein